MPRRPHLIRRHGPTPRNPPRRQARRLRLESLEDRRLLTITVNTLIDELDGNLFDGDISLRDAIAAAPSGETIDFSITGTIELSLGELPIRKELRVKGPGARLLTIDAGHGLDGVGGTLDGFRIFNVDNDAEERIAVEISGLTLTGGDAPGPAGGAIRNLENLKIVRSTVSGNAAQFGGGLYSTGSAQIHESTFAGNRAEDHGGAIFSSGPLTLTNSTVSGNTAKVGGGVAATAIATIQNSTIASNTAFANSDAVYALSTTTINNSILTGAVHGSAFTGSYNLFSRTVAISGSGNQIGTDPRLGPLADNGGPTPTHALLPGSPALDAAAPMVANFATGGNATQSSDYAPPLFLPAAAIDGDLTTFTHTSNSDDHATWEVSLPTDTSLRQVVLHNRSDCCHSRLRDITIEIIDSQDRVQFTSGLLNPENVLGNMTIHEGPESLALDLVALTGGSVVGRTVRVARTPDPDFSGVGGIGIDADRNVLSLSEVELLTADQRGLPRVAHGGIGIRQDIGAYELQHVSSADFDSDGKVDGTDFLAWQRGFGIAGAHRPDGNSDDDDDVDASDLAVWEATFGPLATTSWTVAAALSPPIARPMVASAATELPPARRFQRFDGQRWRPGDIACADVNRHRTAPLLDRAIEDTQLATRHKRRVAAGFLRISRWREDVNRDDAGQLQTLKSRTHNDTSKPQA
jgi:predicted outer membrane repeat protein